MDDKTFHGFVNHPNLAQLTPLPREITSCYVYSDMPPYCKQTKKWKITPLCNWIHCVKHREEGAKAPAGFVRNWIILGT